MPNAKTPTVCPIFSDNGTQNTPDNCNSTGKDLIQLTFQDTISGSPYRDPYPASYSCTEECRRQMASPSATAIHIRHYPPCDCPQDFQHNNETHKKSPPFPVHSTFLLGPNCGAQVGRIPANSGTVIEMQQDKATLIAQVFKLRRGFTVLYSASGFSRTAVAGSISYDTTQQTKRQSRIHTPKF